MVRNSRGSFSTASDRLQCDNNSIFTIVPESDMPAAMLRVALTGGFSRYALIFDRRTAKRQIRHVEVLDEDKETPLGVIASSPQVPHLTAKSVDDKSSVVTYLRLEAACIEFLTWRWMKLLLLQCPYMNQVWAPALVAITTQAGAFVHFLLQSPG